jgi:hypothetical protein
VNPSTREERKRVHEIERELVQLATMPNVRVFATEHDARRAEVPRLVVRAPSVPDDRALPW